MLGGLPLHALLRRKIVADSTPFDPATMFLSAWWRVFTNTDPQLAQASAGLSGLYDLEAASSTTTVGASLNGLDSLEFSGAYTARTTSFSTIDDFVQPDAFSFWAFVEADSVVADPGPGLRWQGNGIFYDGLTFLQVCVSSAGAMVGISGTGANYQEVVTGDFTTGSPQLIQVRWDGVTLEIRVNNGAWAQTALATDIDNVTGTFVMGISGGSQFFDGRMWDIGFSDQVFSDTDFNNIRSYITSRYGVSV